MKRWGILAVVVFSLVLGVVWRLGKVKADRIEQEAGAARRKGAPPKVMVATAVRRTVVVRYETVGTVEPADRVEIEPKVAGRVQGLMVREGETVAKGSVVASIRNAELDAQIFAQKARVEEAAARLAEARLGSEPNSAEVEASRRRDIAADGAARANIERIRGAAQAQTAAAESVVADRRARLDLAAVAVPNARNLLGAAEATLANVSARANRLATLAGKGYVPSQDVENARTQVEVQRAAVEVARGQLAAAEEARRSAAALLSVAEKEAIATAERGRAEVESARATASQTGAAVDLAKANAARVPAYRARVGALAASLSAARGDLRNLEALKATTTLRAPITGVIVERLLDNGALCTSAQVIAVVEDLRTVRVRVEIPEEVVAKVHVGDAVDITADSLPGVRLAGRVAEINAAVDSRTHQCRVRVAVDNRRGDLRSGVFARAVFIVDRRSGAVVVPAEALRTEAGRTEVAVVGADDTVKWVPVTASLRDGQGVAVEGLHIGDRVIVRAAARVREGAKVKVSETSGTGEASPPRATDGSKP